LAAVRALEVSAGATLMGEMRKAGAMPKSNAVRVERPKVKARTCRSGFAERAVLWASPTTKLMRKRVPEEKGFDSADEILQEGHGGSVRLRGCW